MFSDFLGLLDDLLLIDLDFDLEFEDTDKSKTSFTRSCSYLTFFGDDCLDDENVGATGDGKGVLYSENPKDAPPNEPDVY